MYLFRNARCFSQYRDLQVISLIAETSLREHGAGRRAPASAVSTGGRAHARPSLRITDSLIAFPSTPAARLPEDVACCSRVFTRGRRDGRPTISVARVLLPVASASRATTGRLALFDRRLGKYLTR